MQYMYKINGLEITIIWFNWPWQNFAMECNEKLAVFHNAGFFNVIISRRCNGHLYVAAKCWLPLTSTYCFHFNPRMTYLFTLQSAHIGFILFKITFWLNMIFWRYHPLSLLAYRYTHKPPVYVCDFKLVLYYHLYHLLLYFVVICAERK